MRLEYARRRLIVAGTANFDLHGDWELPQVPDEIRLVISSFATVGYTAEDTLSLLNPTAAELKRSFTDAKLSSRPGEMTVAYYSSHGKLDPDRFYLFTRDTDEHDLDNTAIPASELARALIKESRSAQLLLILDSCSAGAGVAESVQLASRLASVSGGGPEVFVIAAARSYDQAAQSAFANGLTLAMRNADGRLGGSIQEFLPLDVVVDAVNGYLAHRHPGQTATLSSSDVRGICRLLPNPLFLPAIRPGLDLETQRAFSEHWVPKARSAELGASGWYFTGREHALSELIHWLSSDQSGRIAHVVTGGPGSGKSSVLARIVLLADPEYRKEVLAGNDPALLPANTLPPEGIVDVAVHARHKLVAEVTEQIAKGLGMEARDPVTLLDLIAQRQRKTVIILDALDEADESDQITSRLLRPLAALSHVFLIIGTRPDSTSSERRFRGLGDATHEIVLDSPKYMGADDVALYVEKRLLATEEPSRQTPYQKAPDVARIVARSVSVRADGVFLIAYTAVQALLASDGIVDVSRSGWADELPNAVGEAFDLFLSGLDTRAACELGSSVARAVLLPLAFAEGEGIPWVDIWASVASALSGFKVSDADVALARKHAAAFIVESAEQDRSVYRLYHERLAEHLRDGAGDARRAQQEICGALTRKLPSSPAASDVDWENTQPYIRTHLATHALRAGTLGNLLSGGMFIAAAEPMRLLAALSQSEDALSRRVFSCYSLAFDRLRNETTENRLSYLELVARQEGQHDLAEWWSPQRAGRPWSVRWAHCWPVKTHRVIGVSHKVYAATLGQLDGRQVLVTGGSDCTVRMWDLLTGDECRGALRGHRGAVTAVAIASLHKQTVIVSGGADRTLRVWDLSTGQQRGAALKGHQGEVRSVAVTLLDGVPTIISSGADQTVRAWNLATGRQHSEPLLQEKTLSTPVMLGTVTGRPVLAWGTTSGVSSWDLRTKQLPRERDRGHRRRIRQAGPTEGLETFAMLPRQTPQLYDRSAGSTYRDASHIECVALAPLWNGRTAIVSGGRDQTIRVLDLTSLTTRGRPMRGHEDRVSYVSAGTLGERFVIVSGSWDQTICLWDIENGQLIAEPLRGHEDRISFAAAASLSGRHVIVSAAWDRTVRVWDANSMRRSDEPDAGRGAITSVAVGNLGRENLVVSGGWDKSVGVWNRENGAPHGAPLLGHTGPVTCVAACELQDRLVLVSGSLDQTVRSWDLQNPGVGHPLSSHGGAINALAMGVVDGHAIVVAGDAERTVQIWDAVRRAQYRAPLVRPRGAVLSLALGMWDERSVVISGGDDGTIHIWDITSGQQIHEPLRGHRRSVNAVALGSLDGHQVVVSGGSDKAVRIWDLASGMQWPRVLNGHEHPVRAIALGVIESRCVIYSGGDDETVRVWDPHGAELAIIRIGSDVLALASAGSGKIVVAARRGLLLVQFGRMAD